MDGDQSRKEEAQMTKQQMAAWIIGVLGTATIVAVLAISQAAHADEGIEVWHDEERNVTCWETVNGLSCLPDWMLTAPTKPMTGGARI